MAPQPRHLPRPLLPSRPGSVRLHWLCHGTCLPWALTRHQLLAMRPCPVQDLAPGCKLPAAPGRHRAPRPRHPHRGEQSAVPREQGWGGTEGDRQPSCATQAVFCKASCRLWLPAVGSTVPRGWQRPGSGRSSSSPSTSLLVGRRAAAPRRGTDPGGTCWGLDVDCGRIVVPITGTVTNGAETSGSQDVNRSKGIRSPWGIHYRQDNLQALIPTDGR